MTSPLTVTCPKCGAVPGKKCHTPSGQVMIRKSGMASVATSHKDRFDLANEVEK